MVDTTLNTLLRNYTRVSKILIIPINIGLIYWFINYNTNVEYYLILSLIILINVHFIYFLKFKASPKVSSIKLNKSILSLIDDIPYAKSNNSNEKYQAKETPISSVPPKDKRPSIEKSFKTPQEEFEYLNDSLYDNPIEVNEYLDRLENNLSDNGFVVPKNTLRETFASMAATRFMVLTNNKPEIIKAYVDCFSTFIGAKYFCDSVSDEFQHINTPESLQECFSEVISAAEREPNRIHITLLNEISIDGFSDFINELIREHFEPFPINKKQTFYLPNNLWFILVPKSSEKTIINKVLQRYTMPIELTAKPYKSDANPVENPLKLSYEHMSNLFSGAYEQFYLDEETWKKFDELGLYINQYHAFQLSNPFVRQLERFTSVFLMFSGDKKVAVDTLLHGKLLPLISSLNISDSGAFYDETLKQLDKWFGLENLNSSKTWLKKQIKVAEKND